MPKRKSVKKVLDNTMDFQGKFLEGPRYESVKAVTQSIFECAERAVNKEAERREVKRFKLSTPQGEEVSRWLGGHNLSCYESTFAKNKLDSLHKASKLASAQVDKLHDDFCRSATSIGETNADHLGVRVLLGNSFLLHSRRCHRKQSFDERNFGQVRPSNRSNRIRGRGLSRLSCTTFGTPPSLE